MRIMMTRNRREFLDGLDQTMFAGQYYEVDTDMGAALIQFKYALPAPHKGEKDAHNISDAANTGTTKPGGRKRISKGRRNRR